MSAVTKHIGARIRFYRKNMGLTLEELANAIHKSKSTLSKYEAGSVIIDVDSLFDIAKALQIPVEKLMDYKEPLSSDVTLPTAKGFFHRAGNYYMYDLDAATGHIVHSVIEIKYSAEEKDRISAVFYRGIKDYENLFHCRYYYSGEMVISDLYTNFSFHNQVNPAEKVFISAVNSLNNVDYTLGLVAGISSVYLIPTAFKAIFSRKKLENETMLLETLKFSKDDISQLKKKNVLLLKNIQQHLNH